jgi:hypothetical protein
MKRNSLLLALFLLGTSGACAAYAQQHQASPPTPSSTPKTAPAPKSEESESESRDAVREKVRAILTAAGQKLNVEFKQGTTQPYNFVGLLKTGLKTADAFEIVVSIGEHDTIHFRVYPYFAGEYINLDKVKNSNALARQMIRFSDTNFLYWGADDDFDIFAGYSFTLESGFPEESFRVVLMSIPKLDEFVLQMKPAITGRP